VAAASDKTVSLRRAPFWVFRILVKCNIASQDFAEAKGFADCERNLGYE
jgi:hypothetical protein